MLDFMHYALFFVNANCVIQNAKRIVMQTLEQRLKLARERAGFPTVQAVIDRFGWTYSTYAGHENGSRGVPRAKLLQYATAFNVTPDWLLQGGPDPASSQPVKVEDGQVLPSNAHLVPVLDIRASAGYGVANPEFEQVEYTLAFPPDYLRSITRADPKSLAIIGVKGDSMTPTLHDDDIVMVDLSKTNLGYDGLFVLRFDGALHVKRISRSGPGHVTVISDNRQNYPPIEYRADDVEVVGKVIWKGGKV